MVVAVFLRFSGISCVWSRLESPKRPSNGSQWLTTIQPSAGEAACSVGLTVSVSVADVFGATSSNMPVFTADVFGLNVADPSLVSSVLSVSESACTEYVKCPVEDRHGFPGTHSWSKSTGRIIELLSVGASAT